MVDLGPRRLGRDVHGRRDRRRPHHQSRPFAVAQPHGRGGASHEERRGGKQPRRLRPSPPKPHGGTARRRRCLITVARSDTLESRALASASPTASASPATSPKDCAGHSAESSALKSARSFCSRRQGAHRARCASRRARSAASRSPVASLSRRSSGCRSTTLTLLPPTLPRDPSLLDPGLQRSLARRSRLRTVLSGAPL